MEPSWLSAVTAQLERLQSQGRYRSRAVKGGPEGPETVIDGRRYLNFSSNDYLGLANHPRVKQALLEGVARYGLGAAASQLVTGYTDAHRRLEQDLAQWMGTARALVFSSGYLANLGVIGALAGPGDTVLEDRNNHASLLDAALMSRARLRRFVHRDLHSLQRRLDMINDGRVIVATDTVFSMQGTLAPLAEIAALCRRYGVLLMADDAHGIGVLGAHGQGAVAHLGLGAEEVPVRVGTFGKALGGAGAFVAGPEPVIELLIQKARTYIYTTGLPPALAVATSASLELLCSEPWRRHGLWTSIQYFRERAQRLGIPLQASDSAIHSVILGEAEAAMEASRRLRERGIYIVAIRPPTVPEGSARLRIVINAAHSREHLDHLLSALADLRGLGAA
ncbi:MAG: 8-amino-7-oxononanoate synthase [Gammaproteobacteria bacterium]